MDINNDCLNEAYFYIIDRSATAINENEMIEIIMKDILYYTKTIILEQII